MIERRPLLQTLVHGTALAVLAGWVLHVGRDVFVPVAYSAVLAYIVLGMARQARRIPVVGPHLSPGLRYALAAVVILGAVWVVALLVLASVAEIMADAPRYERAVLGTIQRIAAWLGIETEPTWRQLRQMLYERVGVARLLGLMGGAMFHFLAILAVVVLYAVFLLAEKRVFDRKIDRLHRDPARAVRVRTVIHAVNERIGNYLALKTLLSAGIGTVTWAAMAWGGFSFAPVAGLAAGLLNYIPYAGSVLGVAVPAVLALVGGADLAAIAWLCAGLSLVQFLNGHLLDPWLMGNSLNLSPFVILFSLAAWSALWGIPGALLAVPFAAIMLIVFREFEGTRALAVLLSRDGRVQEEET